MKLCPVVLYFKWKTLNGPKEVITALDSVLGL